MNAHPTWLITGLLLATAGWQEASAFELYHWVDENGIKHFSQWKPEEESADVVELTVEDNAPAGYDPGEDRYNLAATQAAMEDVWNEHNRRREESMNRRAAERDSTVNVVHYEEPYAYSDHWYAGYPVFPAHPPFPRPPKPPMRPHPAPPIESVPFRPPGQARNR